MVFVDHAPVMAALRPGVLTITGDGGNTTKLFVRGGFAEVSGSALTILADDAMPLEQLDAASVDRQLKHLEEQLEIAQDDEAQRSATEKLAQMRDLRSALKL